MRYLFSTCMILTLSLFAFYVPLKFNVHGVVTDAQSGHPIASASIVVKGGSATALSGANGEFSISVPGDTAILVCTAVGYQSKEVPLVDDGKPVSVKLVASSTNLDEVVVVGYENRKMYKTASATTVKTYNQPAIAGQPREDNSRISRGLTDTTADWNTEGYDEMVENRFLTATDNPLSTFSIDVDGASYSNVRRFLQTGQMPPAGSVRIEELINYFHYEYPQPMAEDPFSINTEIADCPWNDQNKLVMIGLQGKKVPVDKLPASNLVFLIDVSGSMLEPDKLPLVQSSLKLLVDQLREQDRVSLVVYAGNAGLVMPSTSGIQKEKIKDAIDRLEAGGSTAGGAGIQLAYKVARENFINGANNRVILCTDGDFNVGESSDAALEHLIEKERASGVYLTVLGFGTGNYQDSKMQKLADKGNGNHSYIDNLNEARKVLVNEFGGTLFTIAKDVKLQIEFNPAKVQAYRLIGYENRMLNKEDFNNDQKDAGDLGSGHTVTAVYEIIPIGVKSHFIEKTDPLKYQTNPRATEPSGNELMTIKFRYKKPGEEKSKLIEHAVIDQHLAIQKTSDNFRFVAAVAQFGMLLRHSEFKEQASFRSAIKLAQGSMGTDTEGYRSEFLTLLKQASSLSNQKSVPAIESEDQGSE